MEKIHPQHYNKDMKQCDMTPSFKNDIQKYSNFRVTESISTKTPNIPLVHEIRNSISDYINTECHDDNDKPKSTHIVNMSSSTSEMGNDNPSLQLYINVEMQLESRTYTYEMNDHKNTILIITRELYKTPGFQKRIRIINVHRLISKTLIANTSIY